MHYFIGLTFFQNYLQFKKIDSLRRRFDSKYSKSTLLQMTLLPPFRLPFYDNHKIKEVFEHLEEELDGHLLGLTDVGQIEFKGIDFKSGRKGMLYLKPTLPIDLFHCRESLRNILSDYGASFKKEKHNVTADNLEVVLPIGRFSNPQLLEIAVETAKNEFNIPFTLQANHITVFEKIPGQWLQRKKLFNFIAEEHDISELNISGPRGSAFL